VIAGALMADLGGVAAELQHEWCHVAGDCRGIGRHCWVEADGRAFDLSHGDRRPALVLRVPAYVAMREAKCVVRGAHEANQRAEGL